MRAKFYNKIRTLIYFSHSPNTSEQFVEDLVGLLLLEDKNSNINLFTNKGEPMKQKLVYLLLAVIFSRSAQATPAMENRVKATQEKMKFVPTIGTSSFTLKGTEFTALSYHSGMSMGGLVQIPSESVPDLSYQAGVEYIQAGASLRYIYIFSGEDAVSFDQSLHYLSLPANAQFDFYKTEEGNYFVKGGAALAYLISAKQDTKVFGADTSTDVTDKMNRLDLFLNLGFGYKKSLLGGDLLMDLGYSRGTQQVSKDTSGHSEGFLAKVSYTIDI